MAAAAATLGIAHPTGYPTLMLLGFLFTTIVPLRDIVALNVMAALLTAGGIGFAMLALTGTSMLAVAVVVAFAGAWGWAGLLTFIVVAVNVLLSGLFAVRNPIGKGACLVAAAIIVLVVWSHGNETAGSFNQQHIKHGDGQRHLQTDPGSGPGIAGQGDIAADFPEIVFDNIKSDSSAGN